MVAHGSCFPRLHVIHDPVARPGPMNMALDEVLLGSVGEAVVLRLYDWSEPTVSYGFFEPSAAARRVAGDRAVVRRWTGGGLVEHGEDLTYSLFVPRSCPFTALRSTESYRWVHAAVATALSRCDMPAESHDAPVTSPSPVGAVNACFERPVLHDLVVGGRKIAGGAQRRNRVGLLHQGSVQPGFTDPDTLLAWKRVMRRELPLALGECCEERELAPLDIAQARTLAEAKYASHGWTNRV